MSPEFFSNFIDTAPSLGISLFALWIISKRLWSSQEQHLATLRERIEALERHTEECNKDRAELHKMHTKLQLDVINQMSSILEDKNK